MKHLVTIAALILGLAATGPGFAIPDLQEIKFNKSSGKTYDSILLRNVKLLDQENPG